MAKIFITTGLVLVFIGLIIHLSGDKLSWFGNLYGDIKIVKSNFTIYSPITSMIILSVLLSVILNIVIKFFSKWYETINFRIFFNDLGKKRRKKWIILDRILAVLFPVTILIQYSQKGLGLEFYLVTILFTLMFISILKRLWNNKQFADANRESNR